MHVYVVLIVVCFQTNLFFGLSCAFKHICALNCLVLSNNSHVRVLCDVVRNVYYDVEDIFARQDPAAAATGGGLHMSPTTAKCASALWGASRYVARDCAQSDVLCFVVSQVYAYTTSKTNR